jgi:hypothetical protein
MWKHHFIFLHSAENNDPLVLNSEFILYATKNDDDCKNVVSYDYYELSIIETDEGVNETPEKIFTLVPKEDFVLLHDAETNKVILVRIAAIISMKSQDGVTHLTLIGDNVLEVNETPMRIRDIIVTGKQVRALKPAQAKPTKKDKNKEDSK